jgi:hypothetical protein
MAYPARNASSYTYPTTNTSVLLKEDGDSLLTEDGNEILIENVREDVAYPLRPTTSYSYPAYP